MDHKHNVLVLKKQTQYTGTGDKHLNTHWKISVFLHGREVMV